jgi:hypothetical protein
MQRQRLEKLENLLIQRDVNGKKKALMGKGMDTLQLQLLRLNFLPQPHFRSKKNWN